VNLGTGTLNLTGKTAGGSVTVNGALTAASLTTAANNNAITLNGGGSITGAAVTTFSNTGNVTINGVTFTGGVSSTGAGTNTLLGTVATGGAAGQDISLDDLTIGAGGLTMNTGAGGAIAVSGVTTGGANDLTITRCGSATFAGDIVNVAALSAGAFAFPISFNSGVGGQATTITGAATLSNTGAVSFGNDAADSFSAAGGLAHSGGTSTLIGTVSTTDMPLTLGAVTISGACTVDAGTDTITLGNVLIQNGVTLTLGTGAATTITTASISGGAGSVLTINTTGTATVGGAIAIGSGTLTVTAGTVDVGGNNFTIGTLVNNGTFQLTGAQGTQSITTPDTDSGTVSYYGAAGGVIRLSTFYTLSINGAGTFTLNQPIFVGNPAGGGQVLLSAGTLDVTAANHQITVYGDWNNNTLVTTTFNCRLGTVVFAHPAPGTITIFGDNNWYIFDCQVPGITIRFEQGKTQTMVNVVGAVFRVKGLAGNRITLDSDTALPYWNFTLNVNAVLDIAFVDIFRSNATITIPVPPTGITITNCLNWVTALFVVSSRTEDFDHNGKIDRIRVLLPANINDNFSDFTASVAGYDLSYTGPGGLPFDGTDPALGNDEFWILLVEKPYLDTDATTTWDFITPNTQLRDAATGFYLVDIDVNPAQVIDTAEPIFSYTLAVTNKNEIFVQFSEPVERPGGGAFLLDGSDFAYSGAATVTGLTRITTSGNGTSELLLTLSANVTVMETVTPATLTTVGAPRDQAVQIAPSPPWPLVPNVIPVALRTHRVTDVGLGLANDGVMEPVWANDGIFTILLGGFAGTRWLRDVNSTLEAHVHDDIGLDPDTRLWFDVNVPSANRSTSGLWLPPFNDSLYTGIVPWPVSPFPRAALDDANITTQLRDYVIPSSDAELKDGVTLEFVFQILAGAGIAADLYCARVVDATAVDWYRHVEPWSFDVHDERTQKGGVSILKNVINPDLGEVTTLHYTLEKTGIVTISVFDLAGDLVRVLTRGSIEKGEHLQTWDGKNSTGRTVARGVYFIRIRGPGIDEVRKVLVIR
jgi:fibronectin-binding autotransporter adhesin